MKTHRLIVCVVLILAVSACAVASEAPKAAEPAKKPAPFTEKISGTLVKFDMVPIPAGEIRVADPAKKGATKIVKIKPFYIGKTEVTWDEYDVFVFKFDEPESPAPGGPDAVSHPSKPYGACDRGYGHKGYPAMNLSYYGAEQYCKWLSLKTGRKYRLATEAEWEYACLAGKPVPAEKDLPQFAWFWQEKTQPVGKKKPNAWGIHDMYGNVAEWCVGLDGKPVACGGHFEDFAGDVTASKRIYQEPSWQANDPQNPKSKWWLSDAQFVGFRIVCEQESTNK